MAVSASSWALMFSRMSLQGRSVGHILGLTCQVVLAALAQLHDLVGGELRALGQRGALEHIFGHGIACGL